LWYLAHRKAKQARNGNGEAIEGSARRVEAKRATKTARKRAPRKTTRAQPAAES
jgi:hypothetical protein